MTLDLDRVATLLPAYDVGPELGRGGWGIVINGRHRALGREVAIKQLPRAFGSNPAVRARFVAEARLLASLDHPHIVPIYDFVEQEGLCLLVMEKLTGGTLWSRFQDAAITFEGACASLLAVLTALNFAHSRAILHRDVKPENVMFAASGSLKVTDFGIAKVLGGPETVATMAGEVIGTPAYMSPEQAQGAELTAATDVYSAGVMLFELLSGRLPFSEEGGAVTILYRHVHEQPESLSRLAPGVPEPVADAVMVSLATSPSDRFPSAEAFAIALATAATASWGTGWLDGSGIAVSAASKVLAAVGGVAGGPALTAGENARRRAPPTVRRRDVAIAAATVHRRRAPEADTAGRATPARLVPVHAVVEPGPRGVSPTPLRAQVDFAAATEFVDVVIETATRAGRPDLVSRLSRGRHSLDSAESLVLVSGDYKRGKSSLVNALLGIDACPVDDGLATTTLTVLRAGSATGVRVVAGTGEIEDVFAFDAGRELTVEHGIDAAIAPFERVELDVADSALGNGTALVEVPMRGGLGGGQAVATLAMADVADVFVFVADAARPLSAAEVAFLGKVATRCQQLVVCVTKTDLHRGWRPVVAENRVLLDRAGVAARLVPLATTLRREALGRGDTHMDAESGFPTLVSVLVDATALSRRAALAHLGLEVHDVISHLLVGVQVDLLALAGDDTDAVAPLSAATEALREGTAFNRLEMALEHFLDQVGDTLDQELLRSLESVGDDVTAGLERFTTFGEWADIGRRLLRVAEHVRDGPSRFLQSHTLAEDAARSYLSELVSQVASGKVADFDASRLEADSAALETSRGASEWSPASRASLLDLLGLLVHLMPAADRAMAACNPIPAAHAAIPPDRALTDVPERPATIVDLARERIGTFIEELAGAAHERMTVMRSRRTRTLMDELDERAVEIRRTADDALTRALEWSGRDPATRANDADEAAAAFRRMDDLHAQALALWPRR
jgi:hypothetical protein